MPSKELIADIAALLADELPEGAYGFDYEDVAKKLCAGFRAALQEPNEAMKEAWDLDTGRWISEEIEDPYHPWRAMLAASALGEQSE